MLFCKVVDKIRSTWKLKWLVNFPEPPQDNILWVSVKHWLMLLRAILIRAMQGSKRF
jgi:hypothetical protein